MNDVRRTLLRVAGVCAIFAPLSMLAGDAVLTPAGLRFWWSIVMWVAFVLFVPAILGLAYLAATHGGGRLALAGGASAYFGAMAGASMQVLFRTHAVLEEQGATDTVMQLRRTVKLVASTQMIGIFYPLGLLMLAFALHRTRLVTPLATLALALGALLFPVGRIGGFIAAVLSSDLFLAIAFVMIGRRLLAAASGEPDRADAAEVRATA